MKDKILAAIKAKFPKVNLSKARLNAIAAKIETKVIDDETKIDAAIDEYNDFNPLIEIAKTDDKIRNLGAKATPAPAKKDEGKPNPDDEVELPEDTPSWAKALIEQNKKLSESVAAMQGKEVANAIKGKATEMLKDIPASYWSKRALPEKVEDLEAFAEDVKTDYQTFTQDMTAKGLSIIPVPGGGGPKPKVDAVDPAVKAFAEKQAAASAPKV